MLPGEGAMLAHAAEAEGGEDEEGQKGVENADVGEEVACAGRGKAVRGASTGRMGSGPRAMCVGARVRPGLRHRGRRPCSPAPPAPRTPAVPFLGRWPGA